MKIKTGDNVKVMKGKDNGKTGKVIQVFPLQNRLVVENLNRRVKHIKPRNKDEKGQKIEFSAPMNVSNVKIICPSCKEAVRVIYKISESGEKSRVCKKCGSMIKS